MTVSRRRFLKTAAGATGIGLISPSLALSAGDAVTPEMFGAKGDGVTNDTDAFAAMANVVNLRGGGTVELRKATYLVGRQFAGQDPLGWAFQPADIMNFRNLRSPLSIRGNGARLKCAPGLRYGLFDRNTGQPFRRPLPYYDIRQMSSPYIAMIRVKACSAAIELSDLELDGSLPELRIGGPYGDTGYQIPAIGLFLEDNLGTETVRNLHSHHHGQDGLEINGDDKRHNRNRFENVVSEYNGRQGLSVIGGRGYDFVACKFNHTGRSAIQSSPGAGVDLEAEGTKTNRDLTFTDCEFSNNDGCGMLAEAGDTEGVVFTRCTFIGATNWSAWANKPRLKFMNCAFVGTVVHPFADPDPARAAQFYDCRFRDDPGLSPTRKIFLEGHAIVDMAVSDNVLFSRCSFLMTHKGLLPWSWRATYSNCMLQQRASGLAYPKGTYVGRNTIIGNVDMYNTKIVGTLIVNGKLMPKGLAGGTPW